MRLPKNVKRNAAGCYAVELPEGQAFVTRDRAQSRGAAGGWFIQLPGRVASDYVAPTLRAALIILREWSAEAAPIATAQAFGEVA